MEIDEPYSGALTIRGGGGKDQFLFGLGGKYLNLFGGGEKIGGMLTTHFFFPAGHKFMYNIGGNIFYEDPHLFVFGKDHPVSGRFEAERASRVNYIDGSLETIMGASITLGVKIAPKTTLLVSPSFYYTAPESGNYEIFQPGLKVALEVDGRDNWLLPKSGYYFLTSVSGGAYFGSTTNAENQKEKFSQFFFANNNEGRFYVQLPVGMVLAFRGVVGFGVNLFGGDIYNTAGPLNPYVRASSNPYAMGPGIVAGSMELRAPVIEIPNSKGTKLQFYGFGDAGYVFNGGVAYGAGVGVRMYIPLLGVINIGWGGPGNWPLGFFFWAGDQGWN
ncbi:MAG: hypothetical protein NT099_02540 [Candidatus Saganbacteria bacterium]|nr:hypothetical protein [Candidatus Saganbacteria bacterium]